MSKEEIKKLQRRLLELGFDPKGVDGVIGPDTEKAIVAFKKSVGLAARPYVGPITLEALFGKDAPTTPVAALPWMAEITKYMGYHEITNNATLRKWLKSDGATLGDPAKLPWCGDCIETAIKLSLPNEPFTGNLKKNPYWALNWAKFGEKSDMRYGTVGAFKRPSGGHVAFIVGYDPKRKRLRVRGGNQSNSVSDTWIEESRLVAIRKPKTWKEELPPIPIMDSRGQIVSTNEA